MIIESLRCFATIGTIQITILIEKSSSVSLQLHVDSTEVKLGPYVSFGIVIFVGVVVSLFALSTL
jgi:hypothetical protein